MLRGYRHFIFALVGCLTLAAANPKQPNAEPAQTSSNQIAEPRENISAGSAEQPAEPAKYQQPCDEGGKERASDLCAQWYAADAARSAANAAWTVGWVGAFIALLTLGAAWLAARYAKLAVAETKRTADLAADTHAADLRPYLFVSKIVPQVRDSGLIDFEIVLQNYGKLPARNILIQHHACYTASGENFAGNVLVEPKVGIPVCAPGHERRVFEYYLMNVEERKAFDAGFGFIVIRIRYRYKGGPRRGRYAERIDYAYTRNSADSGHVYIVSSLAPPTDQPNIPNLLEEKSGEEA